MKCPHCGDTKIFQDHDHALILSGDFTVATVCLKCNSGKCKKSFIVRYSAYEKEHEAKTITKVTVEDK